ncbi:MULTISPECIES: RICIN domain-containing protein [Morganellaceae]|uniref:Ricin B lectin domain-containing protein n=1 Tax=Providencia rettgeri TaxID=587 RepID=A0AAE3CUM7_PRORE|nr:MULTISPECIES: hypothetical protein [Morganellaceae]MBW3115033.1 hypothetical protein [Providencia rettgeri]NHN50564.1 hypothetical protein [Providencia rettgeri]GIZ26687.1 hypothetical protein TUM12149_06570 [Morganella morganii]GIZ30216.1 hypothetical protein TUM12150_07020 [Morganella morganii]GIZ33377.1 hypothetical protein TUM12151_03630 [Morganella morganii]
MKTAIILVLTLILVSECIVLGPRLYKDYQKKKQYKNTFAIVNVQSGLALRPMNANYRDEVPLITYGLHDWECITWEMIGINEPNTYLLKNLYTQKTFQPSGELREEVGLSQQSLGGTTLQYWEFIEKPNGIFLIRLKGHDLYLTASSGKENALVVLRQLQNSENQMWKKVKQNPFI